MVEEATEEEGLDQILIQIVIRLEEEEAGAQCGSAAALMLLLQEEAVEADGSTQVGVETQVIHLLLKAMWEGSAAVVCQAAIRLMLLRDILV